MADKRYKMMDGNEAAASVAYRLSEVIAIYPITPSSPMGESSDAWAEKSKPNLWGVTPTVIEMQSEGGAAGALHGALQTGSLTTTFTSSQGLLLMIPTMYKLAGELTSMVMHIAARSIATHALSIFGDHSDVMAARSTGFALLSSASVQEAADFAAIAQMATLESRIPFGHFFDGFRTSHEIGKIEPLSDELLRQLIDEEQIFRHRERALSPDRPVIRGSAQNPDVFFQEREAANPFYKACPQIVQNMMDRFAKLAGRQYRLFEYTGDPDAERVIVVMGSGGETAIETSRHLNEQGEKTGVLHVRLYRPFDARAFVRALPRTVRRIAVLDRCKEPGATGDPLYLDCVAALNEIADSEDNPLRERPRVISGRYGLSSKEFTPAMAKAIFDELKLNEPRSRFTVGIHDDVSGSSLDFDAAFSTEPASTIRALFYGLGSDGTVGANKNSVKIIGESSPLFAQGYFVYDSKKSGAVTVSHLRFSPQPIRAPYLISRASFVACHQPVFLHRYDMLKEAQDGATFLLNAPDAPDAVWDRLPIEYQEHILKKKIRVFVIDASQVAKDCGLGGRINTVMQACFFALSNILPREQAGAKMREAIEETYGKKSVEIVEMNLKAVEYALDHLSEVKVPGRITGKYRVQNGFAPQAPEFVRDVLGAIYAGRGESLPVSRFPADGTFPTGTAKWEKRDLADEIPVWDPQVCIQCGKCAMVCPHAVIRIKAYEPAAANGAPETFKSVPAKDLEWKGLNYTIQVSPQDCTGCALCVDVCPAKNKSETRLKALNMAPQRPLVESENENWDFFLGLPELGRDKIHPGILRQQQLQQPLFEFSGACSGCGETPYVKLATQLFGDRMVVANATGCSSIYGGSLPTTPWSQNADGRGPAWSNSLFENNAEFGLGMRLSIDQKKLFARELLKKLADPVGADLASAILNNPQKSEADIFEQRERVAALNAKLSRLGTAEARRLLSVSDALVKKSVWIIGGDGWAYDIGYGGLDHVLASGQDVNILVLDTEVYSNTGGQMSKSTPRAAVAKFAAGGKRAGKKDLGLIAMTYGNVYVASVVMGAKDEHTLRAFLEAEAYAGPSLIIAYSHCIAHGIDMTKGLKNQKAAVDTGQWLLYRHHPDRAAEGKNPLQLDSLPPKAPLESYMYMEGRFKMLTKSHPDEARRMLQQAEKEAARRRKFYEYLSAQPQDGAAEPPSEE